MGSHRARSAKAAPLLERDRELAALGVLLADARRSNGRLVVVEGPAGIGKTRLLEEACGASDRLGLRVLHARGGELERDFGFGVVRQLLEPPLAAAGGERSDLLSGAAALAEAVFAPATAPPSGDVAHAVLHGLYWLVVNLSERSPLLIAVDDLQWADGPSLRFLHHLVWRVEGVQVAVIACVRSGEQSPEPALLDALVLDAEVLRPAALSDGAVAMIVRGRLGDAAAPDLCRACHESSQGNPFLLGELLSELAERRQLSAAIDPAEVRQIGPGRIATAVLLRVGRLGPEARALARSVAVFGEVAPLAGAAALAGLEPAVAATFADSLAQLGVLAPGRPLRFAHPVVRTSIYEDIAAGERERLHRRTAELVAGDPEQAAVHLLATSPAGDEQTVAMLRAAARSAVARGAPGTAVRYLRRALAEPPSAGDRAELLGELGTAGAWVGDPDAVEVMRAAFEQATRPTSRAAIGTRLGVMLVAVGGDAKHAAPVFEASLAELEDPALRNVVEALLLWTGVTTLSARALVARRLHEARARVERLPDDQARLLLVPLAIDVAIADGPAAKAAALAQRALAGGALARQCAAIGMPFAHIAGVALTYAGELASATRAFDDAIDAFRPRGEVVPVAAGAAFRAHARYLAGDLSGAEADARLCQEEPTMGGPVAGSVATAALVSLLIERGELGQARKELERFETSPYLPEVMPSQVLRTSRAQLLAAEGRPEGALDELRACERFEREWKLEVGVAPAAWRSPAALSHAELGDMPEARRLAAEEVGLARRYGAKGAIGIALRAHAIVNDNDHETLTEAIELLADSGARLEHARALVDLGSGQRKAGSRTAARASLAEGAALAHRCGATVLTERARAEQRLSGARPRRIAQSGRDALTPAELRVAELAARGDTNKQIAQALFVTQRTVEMHLSNSYRKLDIRSREQLAAALADG